jgi:hypothetical protein
MKLTSEPSAVPNHTWRALESSSDGPSWTALKKRAVSD